MKRETKTMKVKEEIKPTGDGARSERQEPGNLRELDAEVAEKVMGWKRNPNYKNVKATILDMAFEWYASGGYGSNDLPRYSTELSAAMLVVEQFIDTGGRASLRGMRCVTEGFADEYKPLWRVNFYRFQRNVPPGTRFSFDSEAESLPEAICRAALALVDGKQQTEDK